MIKYKTDQIEETMLRVTARNFLHSAAIYMNNTLPSSLATQSHLSTAEKTDTLSKRSLPITPEDDDSPEAKQWAIENSSRRLIPFIPEDDDSPEAKQWEIDCANAIKKMLDAIEKSRNDPRKN
jgi:hypothetical protein